MNLCPCCSQLPFKDCCEPYLLGRAIPSTPEKLMRSRYSAYATDNISYIRNTMTGKALEGFNIVETKLWSRSVKWINLEIINSNLPNVISQIAYVEFIATYIEKSKVQKIHENSKFELINNKWYYTQS